MSCPSLNCTLWLPAAAMLVLTAGCTAKNKTMSTTAKTSPTIATSSVEGEEKDNPMNAPPPAIDDPEKATPIAVISRYAGQIIHDGPAIGAAPAGYVIRDQAGYDALVAALPKHRIQVKPRAPHSKDPLLQRPPIDFTRHMLVVAIRHSMYYGPEIKRVLLTRGRELVIEILHQSPAGIMAMASRSDVGTYAAVVIPRAEEKPIFRVELKTVDPDDE